MLLNDQVAVVTGAGRGIGAATAKSLARHGAAVAVNYFKSQPAAEGVVAEITAETGVRIPYALPVLLSPTNQRHREKTEDPSRRRSKAAEENPLSDRSGLTLGGSLPTLDR
jgi:NAD(P)-dependent dehydrogenase (short-subunit alcohol dehydrogenase family)